MDDGLGGVGRVDDGGWHLGYDEKDLGDMSRGYRIGQRKRTRSRAGEGGRRTERRD